MSTKPPEPSPEQIAQWWGEARDVHADNPGRAPIQLARLAYAVGWEARAAVKESLTAEAPADPIRTALKRLLIMASNELASGQLVYSDPEWDDVIAAARAALAAAPSNGPAVPEGREPAATPPAPAAGEAGKLATLLRGEATNDEINDHLVFMTPAQARRAAALLERQAAPVAGGGGLRCGGLHLALGLRPPMGPPTPRRRQFQHLDRSPLAPRLVPAAAQREVAND